MGNVKWEMQGEKKNNIKTPLRKMVLSECQWKSDSGRKNWFSHLGEERACYKLFVLQKRDALAAIQLFGQICHVRLQLGEA